MLVFFLRICQVPEIERGLRAGASGYRIVKCGYVFCLLSDGYLQDKSMTNNNIGQRMLGIKGLEISTIGLVVWL